MRKCLRCQTDMIEDYDIRVHQKAYGIVITNSTKLFSKQVGKPKVAICPECGEISIYLEDTTKLTEESPVTQ